MTAPPNDTTWRPLYVAGGVGGLVFILLVLIPLVVTLAAPVPTGTAALLGYVSDHRVAYVVQLVCFVGLSVPALFTFAASSVALVGVNRGLAAIGGLLGAGSEIVALAVGSSPPSLHGGLISLSDAYNAAPSLAERERVLAAAEALIASTNAMPWAGILTAAAILTLSSIMGRSIFGRALAVVGIVAGALGVASEALRPLIGPAYAVFGLLLPLWFGWVGLRLLRRAGRRDAAVT